MLIKAMHAVQGSSHAFKVLVAEVATADMPLQFESLQSDFVEMRV